MSADGEERAAIARVLQDYFDGLHHSDTARLARVFHPRALYATASGGGLTALSMDEYLPLVERRPSPASRGDARADRIVSIEFAGPQTAWARVECQVLPRRFIDLLTLVKLDGRWQVIAKVFHFDVVSG
jgi:hypothetical protein